MKKSFFSLTFILFLQALLAQTWAPFGSWWTYTLFCFNFTPDGTNIPPSSSNSPWTMECIGDTVIQNKSCRILNLGYIGERSE